MVLYNERVSKRFFVKSVLDKLGLSMEFLEGFYH